MTADSIMTTAHASVAEPSTLPGWTMSQAPTPRTGEALSGYVRRVATANGLDSLHQLARLLGLLRVNAAGGEEQWHSFANGLGVSAEYLAGLRLPERSSRSSTPVEWDGIVVRTNQIATTLFRACLACVAKERVMRGHWQIHLVTACAEHEAQLIDHCPSCTRPVRFYDATFLWHCPDCGCALADAIPEPARADELAMLASVGQGPESAIPLALRGLDIEARLSVVERLGTLSLTALDDAPLSGRNQKFKGKSDDVAAARTIAESRKLAHAAIPLLDDWPNNLRRLLKTLVDRYPDFDSDLPILRRLGSAAGYLAIKPLISGGSPVEIMQREQKWLVDDVIGHVAAAKPTLAYTVRFKHLDHLAVPSLLHPADYMPQIDVGRALGGQNSMTVLPWIEAGGLQLDRRADGSHAFSRRAVAELIDRLNALSSNEPFQRAGLTAAMKGCSGRYTRFDLSADILAGHVRISVNIVGNGGIAVDVSSSDLARRRAIANLATSAIHREERRSQDTLPRLHLIWPELSTLTQADLDRDETLAACKTVLPRGYVSYPVRDVIAFVQAHVGTPAVFDLASIQSGPGRSWRDVAID